MQTVDPEVQAILDMRAATLAQPLRTATAPDGEVQLVILALGAERYGVESQWVEEVQPSGRITRVPGVPAYWRGLVNLRGRLFPVLDLRAFLGFLGVRTMAEAPAPPTQQIVLAVAAGLTVGLLVDDVPEVRQVSRSTFDPSLLGRQGYLQALMPGITADLVVLLDLDKLLQDKQLIVEEKL